MEKESDIKKRSLASPYSADDEISAEAGGRLLRMLKTYSNTVAIDELRIRLDKLEGRGHIAIPAPESEDNI